MVSKPERDFLPGFLAGFDLVENQLVVPIGNGRFFLARARRYRLFHAR